MIRKVYLYQVVGDQNLYFDNQKEFMNYLKDHLEEELIVKVIKKSVEYQIKDLGE